jgi:transcriptional regulator with XRE-family HTH domain
MSTSSSSPTARRWELAARLRDLRTSAGRTVEEVAAELMCSPAKISRLETAGRGIQPRDVRDLCRFYGVPEKVQRELLQLATDARKPGWWQDFRSLDEQTATFLGLESAAIECRQFSALVVPGILQSPNYAMALVSQVRTPGYWDATEVAEIVATRARRRQRLLDGQLEVWAILDEAIFERPVGSPDIMASQVADLIAWADLPNVHLQVVGFSAGSYPGLDGSFLHLRFAQAALGDVVYVEGLLGQFLLDKSSDIERYLEVFSFISESVALSQEDAVSYLRNRYGSETNHTPSGI